MSKAFNSLLALLFVGLMMTGEGWSGASYSGHVPDLLTRAATGLIVCLILLKLGQLGQEMGWSVGPSLQLMGAGVVVLQAIEQFGWPGYLSVLGGTVAALGAVSLLLSLHKTLRV